MNRYLPRKDRYFGLFDEDFFDIMPPMEHSNNLMKTDIHENEKSYNFEIEVPGIKKEDIKISLNDGYLTINASYKQQKDEKQGKKYLRKERFEGNYTRSFYLGNNVKDKDISADYKDGILNIEVLKPTQENKEEKTYIQIK